MRTRSWWLLTILLLAAGNASAQLNPQISPPNPTSLDTVILRFTYLAASDPQVTRVGNSFRVDLQSPCILPCATTTHDEPLGVLAAGNYTYEFFEDGGPTPLASGAFVVTAHIPEAPALAPAMLATFCALLMGVGLFVVGRRT